MCELLQVRARDVDWYSTFALKHSHSGDFAIIALSTETAAHLFSCITYSQCTKHMQKVHLSKQGRYDVGLNARCDSHFY